MVSGDHGGQLFPMTLKIHEPFSFNTVMLHLIWPCNVYCFVPFFQCINEMTLTLTIIPPSSVHFITYLDILLTLAWLYIPSYSALVSVGGGVTSFTVPQKKCGRAWFLFRINLIMKEDNLAPHQSVMFCQQASSYLKGGKLCLNDPLCCWCSVIHSSIRLTEYTHRTVT